MQKPAAYLDYAASTPIKPDVLRVMTDILAGEGNASSVHSFGRERRARVEEARRALADIIQVKPAEVIFTGGATEANNMALQAVGKRPTLISSIEHSSIIQTASGAIIIRVKPDGLLDINHLHECLKAAPEGALVSIMLVNNETGVVQPVAEAAKIAKAKGAIVHCDAVQALGRVPFTRESLGVDMLSLSAHKIGGPQGVGALIVREGLPINPFLKGGGQEMRRRAGTENVAGIAGFGVAAGLAGEDIEKQRLWSQWRDSFESTLTNYAPEAVIFGHAAPRAGCFSCIAMPHVKSETQLMAFDLAGFAVSAGSACSSGKIQVSPVLKAMGAEDALAGSAIRVTFGWNTKRPELEGLAEAWRALYNQKKSVSALGK